MSELSYYLEYKTESGEYRRVQHNTPISLNGFVKNFTTEDMISGGSNVSYFRLYGSLEESVVNAWSPTEKQKAPSDIFYSRISYATNNDHQYLLLSFDFSESFLKNYTEDIIYNDFISQKLFNSIKVKLSVGGINQESYDFLTAEVSSDYFSINKDEATIGILFTSNENIQQFLADNSTITGIKYLIYNYLPKRLNNQNEYVPIKIELVVPEESNNKITPKQIGSSFPFSKIDELVDIVSLQKTFFSALENENVGKKDFSRKTTYISQFNMPITEAQVQRTSLDSFDILNSFHSLSFNTFFGYKKYYDNFTDSTLFDQFKYGRHVYEEKPDILELSSLPKTITIKNVWEGGLSSITYSGFFEARPLSSVFMEIIGFIKHIIWLYNEENSNLRSQVLLRRIYLKKLNNILRNMLFVPPSSNSVDDSYYLRQDIYKNYKRAYDYNQYSGENLTAGYTLFLQMFVRCGLYLVDLLWSLESSVPNEEYFKNKKFYYDIEDYLFNFSKKYKQDVFPTLEILTPGDIEDGFRGFYNYLLMLDLISFAKTYLRIFEGSKLTSKEKTTFFSIVRLNSRILDNLANQITFMKIFDPEKITNGSEILYSLDPMYDITTFYVLLESNNQYYKEMLGNKNLFSLSKQFWHLVGKDFQTNGDNIGDVRLIFLKNPPERYSLLDKIDIIAAMRYAFSELIITNNSATISVKFNLSTNL